MAESPDLEALARRYLDLWQDQMAAMAADPELSDTLARLWQTTAAGGPAGWAALWGAAAPNTAATPGAARTSAAGTRDPSAGPTPAAAPPRQRADDVADLARRVAELEVRLGRIEAALAVAGHDERRGAGARRRARQPRSEGG
jgi:hypothetical protein